MPLCSGLGSCDVTPISLLNGRAVRTLKACHRRSPARLRTLSCSWGLAFDLYSVAGKDQQKTSLASLSGTTIICEQHLHLTSKRHVPVISKKTLKLGLAIHSKFLKHRCVSRFFVLYAFRVKTFRTHPYLSHFRRSRLSSSVRGLRRAFIMSTLYPNRPWVHLFQVRTDRSNSLLRSIRNLI